MIFKHFYDDNLAQASYLIGCETTRTAIVIDPTTDVQLYVEAATREKLAITHITETHVHADFLSGGADLAAATGAELALSAEGGPPWGYDFGSATTARPLRNGDEIVLGSVTLRALHTPGHTPEHLTFLVTDEARGATPVGAATGDFIFVGDVGRPDLLERAVGARGTMRESAAALFKSLQTFRAHADHLQIWPGHGAGSACGKALGSMPASTLGYEKLFNWAFRVESEQEFVEAVLKDQPVPPRYFAEMKRRNRLAMTTPTARAVPQLPPDSAAVALKSGATIVDARPAEIFAEGHIPGTLNVPLNKSFLNWMGALVDYDRELILILPAAGDAEQLAAEIRDNLRKIGLEHFTGWLGEDAISGWRKSQGKLQVVAQLGLGELHSMKPASGVRIIDVRAPHEWAEGHLPGAVHIPLASLPERAAELVASAGGPIAIHCRGGGRSSIASSLLQARGAAQVLNVTEGYVGWVAAGYPVDRDKESKR
jgi:hydroxyacylglutathione hydrolase